MDGRVGEYAVIARRKAVPGTLEQWAIGIRVS